VDRRLVALIRYLSKKSLLASRTECLEFNWLCQKSRNGFRPLRGRHGNSPPIHRWEQTWTWIAVRETDGWWPTKYGSSAVRCADLDDLPGDPSTKVLGYFHLVRCADDNYQTFRAKSVQL